MSDVEWITSKNWEQRRHAEDCDRAYRLMNWEKESYSDCHDKRPEQMEKLKKRWKRMKAARAARDAGRVAMGMSVVSALVGLDLMCPLFMLIAVLFYAAKFELQMGNARVWQKIFG